LLDIGGSRVVDIRIEVPDTRAIDAHIVTQAQIGCLSQFVANAGRRYEIIEVLREVVNTSQFVFHILQGMFVAQSQASR
jgi:hypothetical protein